MGKFSYDDVSHYSFRYDDVSEPLKEYRVGLDGSLTETATSCTLLGVKKNGKWGWIDKSERFVIPALYDSGFVICYDGIIILDKDGCQGGIYRDNQSQAFKFRYQQLGHFYRDTYCAWNFNDRCALLKPGDVMVTGFDYKGFSKYNSGNITDYVKAGWFGDKHGKIDILTGRELS